MAAAGWAAQLTARDRPVRSLERGRGPTRLSRSRGGQGRSADALAHQSMLFTTLVHACSRMAAAIFHPVEFKSSPAADRLSRIATCSLGFSSAHLCALSPPNSTHTIHHLLCARRE
eukprot:scaffold105452_cov57-Phaeocystis_antarctica.AAC.2